MKTADKIVSHDAFWRGNGPSLLFIPQNDGPLYDMTDYKSRFNDPCLMWEGEMDRSRSAVDWPTDGIPAIRPNLGVIVVPALGGQDFEVTAESMPWPGHPMSFEEICSIRSKDMTSSPVYALLEGFYRYNDLHADPEIKAYMADNQGVFDIAHLLYGDDIFYSLMDPDKAGEVKEIMIEETILPYVERSVEPFGGAFLHYCGLHPTIFDQLTGLSCIKAVDLGNPEKYDLEYLLKRCAQTDTVFYCRIPGQEGEHWRDYTLRIGRMVAETGARVVMRPLIVPPTREECEEMLGIWHELTDVH